MNIKHIISISIITCSIYVGSVFGFQQQGFTTFTEGIGGVNASCSSQCALLVEKLGGSDILSLSGTILGQGQISRGFLVSGQVYVVGNQQISATSSVSITAPLKDNQIYDQLQGDPDVIVVLQGNMQLKDVALSLTMQTIGEKISAGILSAGQPIPYSPRTINFVEGPLWNGIYINQAFLPKLLLLLILLLIGYFIFADNRKKIYMTMIILFLFYWIMIDYFATKQQYNRLEQVKGNKSNIMKNARLGQGTDFYDILDKVKEATTAGTQGFILAPYPYSFEGKYHIYPHFRVSTFTGASVVVYYNPMGASAQQFGFVEPVFAPGPGGEAMRLGSDEIYIDKKIDLTPYAKIYFIKK